MKEGRTGEKMKGKENYKRKRKETANIYLTFITFQALF